MERLNQVYLWQYRADAVGRTLYRLAWDQQKWQTISAKPLSRHSGGHFNVMGAGKLGSADARYVTIGIQPEAVLNIQEHVLRIWARAIRECQEKLPREEREALREYLNARAYHHLWEVDRRSRTMQPVREHEKPLQQALLKMTYMGEVGRVERRVIF